MSAEMKSCTGLSTFVSMETWPVHQPYIVSLESSNIKGIKIKAALFMTFYSDNDLIGINKPVH